LQEEQEREDALFAQCMEENDRWNQECAVVRNARLAEESLQREMHILQKQRKMNIEREESQLEWEKYVEEQTVSIRLKGLGCETLSLKNHNVLSDNLEVD